MDLRWSLVKATLVFVRARPAAGAPVLVPRHRAGGRAAADGEVTLAIERGDGERSFGSVTGDALVGPAGDGVDLHQSSVGVPLHDGRGRPFGAVHALQSAH